ncbi:hypothetical protein LEMA_P084940.1 [Plenodomus lingam JN3]|uniref:Uncharacterized protein n=1 Tax=Leptosphaeria maculans (strain JN3 / isolate v23.1.3 / race Av1-4-5-6-7-8) TaxID=985895 RepID=E5A6L0_LEPMJ|nr:hypothetical protein LEMA_P084940.1 [Plenodomus lingam JN3]CBX99255.1 hypothetical protein LEMA_P084940.1 [Plenodomus lingam JN3]
MAHNLAPMPPPGLMVYRGFMAEQPETFLFKSRDLWSSKASFSISRATPSGEVLAPFLDLKEGPRDNVVFRTLDGYEVMRIIRNRRSWSGKGAKYYGMRGEEEIWQLRLVRGLKGTSYELDIHDRAAYGWRVEVHNKVQGQEKGILVEGNPVSTMSRFQEWKHISRQDIVHVAPGMDIMIALGVAWIRADKQEQDTQTVAALV